MEELKNKSGNFSVGRGRPPVVAKEFLERNDLPWRTIRNWYVKFDTIKEKAKRGSAFRGKCYTSSRVKAKYPKMEERLLDKFLQARSKCLKITRKWFETTSRELLLEEYPDDEELKKKGHQLSDSWITKFCKRHGISYRTKSNKKSLPHLNYIPDVYKYCHFALSLPSSIPAEARFHLNQVPLSLQDTNEKTYEMKGSKNVQILSSKVDMSKRTATLQLCFSAKRPKPPISVILHGRPYIDKHGKVNPRMPANSRIMSEMKDYDPRVKVYFNPEAWADVTVSQAWAEDYSEWMYERYDEIILGLDSHGPQATPKFKSKFSRPGKGVHFVYTPPDATHLIAVTDYHIGKKTKDLIKESFSAHFMANKARWVSGTVTTAERRRLIVRWAANAWEKMYDEYFQFISNAFFRCAMASAGFKDPSFKLIRPREFCHDQIHGFFDLRYPLRAVIIINRYLGFPWSTVTKRRRQHIKTCIDIQNTSSYIETYPQYMGQKFIGAPMFHFKEDETY
ncbi:hypothetical protein AAMO2058_001509800 [Amorphochlora amoebiformis]